MTENNKIRFYDNKYKKDANTNTNTLSVCMFLIVFLVDKFIESDFVVVDKRIQIECIQSKSYSREFCDYYANMFVFVTHCFTPLQ